MHKIKSITLKNFKFFKGVNTIAIDRKHVLIYGENGSGKSSIYWGLYTFFQSVFKNSSDVQNYFNPRHDYNLVNRFARGEESYIEVALEDDDLDLRTKHISQTVVNTIGDEFIKAFSICSDLIDYKSIYNLYNFTNRERIKLFTYFEKHLLEFINFQTSVAGSNRTKAKNWWDHLKNGLDPYPNIGGPGYDEFQRLISVFNEEFEFYLESITETANEYLANKFREKIKIKFEYKECVFNELVNGSRTRRTKAPEIFLNVELLNPNLGELERNVYRSHTFLNEARMSSIALALRMAILKEKFIAGVPKVLILDDLLLSLDMGNREAVLNIMLEEYSQDYQIFLLTHDRVFFDTSLNFIKTYNSNLARTSGETNRQTIDEAFIKNWKILEMYETALSNGTIPIPTITEYKTSLQKAHFYFSDSNGLDYNSCGNNLRAALEEFFRNFIPHNFFKDENGQPINKEFQTLNPLIVKCIELFNHVGFDFEILDKLNRYRERSLNPTSHYNPRSNYYKKELQDTFEIINILGKYLVEPMAFTNSFINFEIKSVDGQSYIYHFKILDDIRLYKEPEGTSFYCDQDKRTYAVIGITENNQTQYLSPAPITSNRSLAELYDETFVGLEKKLGQKCEKESVIYDVVKVLGGNTLNQIKKY